jgi:arabinofuranosyltransferase
VRHQEHKVFYEWMAGRLPTREMGSEFRWSERGIAAATSVGVLGWVLPEVAIIDRKGLNDRVIARSPVHPGIRRLMAHERHPPAGYVDCFRPNMAWDGTPEGLTFQPRDPPLTDDDIRACEEQQWY